MILYMLKQLNNMILASILIILIGTIVLLFLEYKEDFSGVSVCGFLTGFIFFMGVLILYVSLHEKPSALDVYRGRTTLKVTYENKTPVDTVVIFKKNK